MKIEDSVRRVIKWMIAQELENDHEKHKVKPTKWI